jgi:hypothetical protein
VGKSGRRKLILRWPEFSTLVLGQLGTEKTQKNMNMEVNGAKFGVRKNGMDSIGMEHTGWAKATKNIIFTLSAKSGLYLDE